MVIGLRRNKKRLSKLSQFIPICKIADIWAIVENQLQFWTDFLFLSCFLSSKFKKIVFRRTEKMFFFYIFLFFSSICFWLFLNFKIFSDLIFLCKMEKFSAERNFIHCQDFLLCKARLFKDMQNFIFEFLLYSWKYKIQFSPCVKLNKRSQNIGQCTMYIA